VDLVAVITLLPGLDEAQAGQLPHDLAVERRLALEVELLEGFEPREPCHPEPDFDPPLLAASPFGFQGLGQEALIVEIRFGSLLTDAVELGAEVLELQPFEEDA
jgi:hypothetical protein